MGTLGEDTLSVTDRLVQKRRRIRDIGIDLRVKGHVFFDQPIDVDGLGTIQCLENGTLFLEIGPQLRLQHITVQQIDDADADALCLIDV